MYPGLNPLKKLINIFVIKSAIILALQVLSQLGIILIVRQSISKTETNRIRNIFFKERESKAL